MEKTVVAAAAAVGAELNNPLSKLSTFSVPVSEDVKHNPGSDKAHYVPATSTRDQQDTPEPTPLSVTQHNHSSNLPLPQAHAFAPYKSPSFEQPALHQHDYNTYNPAPNADANYAMLHTQHPGYPQSTSNHDNNYNHSYNSHLSWREWAESAREHSTNNPAGQAYIPTSDSIMKARE